jgi:hypothetical protein
MKYVLIGSPDKGALSAFVRFLKKELGQDYSIGTMHSLMSDEAKTIFVEDFSKQNVKGIFSYYAKGMRQIKDPKTVLPKKAMDVSDVVIWFDLYSTVPTVLLDPNNFLGNTIIKWNSWINK